jgi:hypothetical protein
VRTTRSSILVAANSATAVAADAGSELTGARVLGGRRWPM